MTTHHIRWIPCGVGQTTHSTCITINGDRVGGAHNQFAAQTKVDFVVAHGGHDVAIGAGVGDGFTQFDVVRCTLVRRNIDARRNQSICRLLQLVLCRRLTTHHIRWIPCGVGQTTNCARCAINHDWAGCAHGDAVRQAKVDLVVADGGHHVAIGAGVGHGFTQFDVVRCAVVRRDVDAQVGQVVGRLQQLVFGRRLTTDDVRCVPCGVGQTTNCARCAINCHGVGSAHGDAVRQAKVDLVVVQCGHDVAIGAGVVNRFTEFDVVTCQTIVRRQVDARIGQVGHRFKQLVFTGCLTADDVGRIPGGVGQTTHCAFIAINRHRVGCAHFDHRCQVKQDLVVCTVADHDVFIAVGVINGFAQFDIVRCATLGGDVQTCVF